jgi:hypothetical protein
MDPEKASAPNGTSARRWSYLRKVRTNVANTVSAPIAGMAITINRGCAAIAASAMIHNTGMPGGNHCAGVRNDGHANHNAAITKPIRPPAAVAKLEDPAEVDPNVSTVLATNKINAINPTIVRRPSFPATGRSFMDRWPG